MIYLRSPQLGLFEEELADSWLAWREEEYGWIYDLEDLTMGSLLYELALADVNTENDPDWYYVYSGTPVYAWSDLTDSAEQWAAVLGDDRFTHTDQGDVFTLDPAALGSPFSELEVTFTVADNGTVTGSFQMQVDGEALYDLTGGIGGTVCVWLRRVRLRSGQEQPDPGPPSEESVPSGAGGHRRRRCFLHGPCYRSPRGRRGGLY